MSWSCLKVSFQLEELKHLSEEMSFVSMWRSRATIMVTQKLFGGKFVATGDSKNVKTQKVSSPLHAQLFLCQKRSQ